MTKCGVDIELVERFNKLPYAENKNFYQKIFSEEEIEYCLGKQNWAERFCGFFCAKEAYIKASGHKLDLSAISIGHDQNGAPYYVTKGERIEDVSLSISHCHTHAIAMCVVN